MSKKKLAKIVLISAAIVIASAAHAATYYVSYSLGNDSNNGTNKTTPWKHAPGMLGVNNSDVSTGDGCTATCALTTINPGDSVILYGGDSWPYTTLPWNITFAGNASSSTYGCTGPGCTYVGYDPTWNKGIVNSVTLTRDLGGCSPSSPPAVSFAGGGGSGAAATAQVIPVAAGAVEGNVAGFVYHVVVTNQGSGYTSNPTVTISGGGCTGITAVADIYRPVIDAGGATQAYDWAVGNGPNYSMGTVQPGVTINSAGYLIIDHLEVRNIYQVARAINGVPPGVQTGMIMDRSTTGHNTLSNNYTHGRFTDCILNSCNAANQEQADAGIISGSETSDIFGNTLENGDSYHTGTGSTSCALNAPCIFSEADIQGEGHIHNNYEYSVRWMVHGGGVPTVPYIINNNEMWLVLYDVGSAHVNELYEQMTTGTLIEYNNIFHSAVSGASNQQQMGNGTTQYYFNNVSWGLGGGTSNWGIDAITGAGPSGGHFYFWNNTIYGEVAGTRNCIDGSAGSYASALNVALQNNHCITTANPYWIQPAGTIYMNQAGSTAQATLEASSAVDTPSAVVSQGYTVSNLFAPTASTNDSVTFASNTNSANLTSLCSGYLSALCNDINGNPRPSSGGWQSGAYFYGSGGSSNVAAPTDLTVSVQ